MPCLSSWPSACDIKSRYLSEDLGSYTVPSHGVAVLTMSKPWQLHLLPSEWSSVTERNETLKLLVPNDPHHITNLQPRPARIARLQSTQPPCIFFRNLSSSTKDSQPKRPKTLPDPINLAYPSRRPTQGGTRHGERRVPSQRTDPRARPPPLMKPTAACPDSVC